MKENITKKARRVKAWAVVCSKDYGMRAFTDKDKAIKHRVFLNGEYPRNCRHKVVKCTITFKV